MRYKPKNPKQKLKSEADKMFKEVIMVRAGYVCEVCGSSFGITAHHFIPRSLAGHLIHYLPNGVCLCQSCHFTLHFKSDPTIVAAIIKKRGAKWLEDLQERRKEKHYSFKTLSYYKDTIKELEKYAPNKQS